MNQIVLFITSKMSGLSLTIYKYVQKEAAKRGVGLMCFCGESFHDEEGKKTPHSSIYNYINKDYVKGIIFNGGAVGHFSTNEYLNSFIDKLMPLPVVSISFPIKKVTNVVVDNYQGIFNVINHLIENHSYKNIAFIKGPEGHPEAEERLKAYLDALKKHDIPVKEELIRPGDFSEEAGVEAVKYLYTTYRGKVDAIACVDDDSALGVFSELKNRGIKVPSDVAVTGFDDIDLAVNLIPSLTTVRQPYDQLVSEAFNVLLFKESADRTVPTASIYRESCGCRDKDVLGAKIVDQPAANFSELSEIIKKRELKISQADLTRVIKALEKDMAEETQYNFIDELSLLIEGPDPGEVTTLISLLHAYAPESEISRYIFHQARIMNCKVLNRLESKKRQAMQELSDRVSQFSNDIAMAKNRDELVNIFAVSFPPLGIPEAHIVLLSESRNSVSLFCSTKGGRLLPSPQDEYNPEDLLPSALFHLENSSNLLIMPYITDWQLIGYGVYQLTEASTTVFNSVHSEINGALSRLLLQEKRNQEKFQLEERNQSIQEQIKPMLDSIKEVSRDSQSEIDEMLEIKKTVSENNKTFSTTLEMLNSISQKIDNVMKAVSIINSISENVNVLAINTSIQSAHAGTYGHAFGVIAKEIRKLSDSTAKNAETITSDLDETIKEFKQFTQINKSNVETFKGFSHQINHFMDVFNNIALKMETLSDNSMKIIEIMDS